MVALAATLIATSRADENALLSLSDLSSVIANEDALILGGHMVAIPQACFPTGSGTRRTTDSDAGLSTQVAASGDIVKRLRALGYDNPDTNNRFLLGKDPEQRVIDLLVPAPTQRFESQEHGGGAFDAVPGLHLALSGVGIAVEVRAILLDGSELPVPVRVPTVEAALVVKALAHAGRRAVKDIEDVHSLLEIANSYDRVEIGGWKLDAEPLTGARLDAGRALNALADGARSNPAVGEARVTAASLALLVRKWVARTP